MAKKTKTSGMEMNLFTDFPQEPPQNLFLHPIPRAVAALATAMEQKQEAKPIRSFGTPAFSTSSSRKIKDTKKLEKITDFGREHGFARKDATKKYIDELVHMGELDADKHSLNELWPTINYKKIVSDNPELQATFSMVRALREGLPRKPRDSWHSHSFNKCLVFAQSLAKQILAADLSEKDKADVFTDCIVKFYNAAAENRETQCKRYVKRVQDLVSFYQWCGHDDNMKPYFLHQYVQNDQTHYGIWKSSASADFNTSSFKLYYGKPKAEADSRNACFDAFERYIQAERDKKAQQEGASAPENGEKPKKHTKFEVYYHQEKKNGKWTPVYYFIGKKINGEIREFKRFQDSKEAHAYRKEHPDELDAMYAAWKKTPEAHPDIDIFNIHGKHHDGPVTMDEFNDTFGFKAVEFGNWVDAKRRQQNLNLCYDALIDLANVLHLPPKALSLNGSLALLFGCNGKGRASAHYEPGTGVINLTKKNGAGCFAHEWFHALDHYLNKLENENTYLLYTDTDGLTSDVSSKFLQRLGKQVDLNPKPLGTTESREQKGIQLDTVGFRDELKDAMAEIQYAIDRSGVPDRSAMNDSASKTYWKTRKEMGARCFEAVVDSLMKEQGVTSQYLVNYSSQERWDSRTGKTNSYPYPTKEELPKIREAYENLISQIRYTETERGTALFSADDYTAFTEMQHITKPVLESELGDKERALQAFSENIFGLRTEFFHGSESLHGLYNPDDNCIYLNIDSKQPMDETLWHEAFHGMRKADELLYHDLLMYTEESHPISQEQIDAFKDVHNIQHISDDTIREELLAQAFSKAKEREAMLAKAPNDLSRRVLSYALSFKDRVESFFHGRKDALTPIQFDSFQKCIGNLAKAVDSSTRYLPEASRILTVEGDISSYSPPSSQETSSFATAGISYLHDYDESARKEVDTRIANKMLADFPKDAVKKTIQQLSPFGHKRNYVRDVMAEATKCACR